MPYVTTLRRCGRQSFDDLWEAALYAEGLAEIDGRCRLVVECLGCDGYHVAGT
ncbi:MAG TPA: hypothetical protein VNJ51_04365 [Candidatus Dormibacteraeota bacterium]|nr:hypothetical protein [Candidatus Dormibacteraeota bacterium]